MRPTLKLNSELTPRAVTLKQLTGAAVLYLGKINRATKQEGGHTVNVTEERKGRTVFRLHTFPMICKMWCRIHYIF